MFDSLKAECMHIFILAQLRNRESFAQNPFQQHSCATNMKKKKDGNEVPEHPMPAPEPPLVLTSMGRPQKAGHVTSHYTPYTHFPLLSPPQFHTPSLSVPSRGIVSDTSPLSGQRQKLMIISFPTCYDSYQCQLGSCASPAWLWQFHPGKFSQQQLYASEFFLPLLLSPSSLLESAQSSISFPLLYPDINTVLYFTRPWE